MRSLMPVLVLVLLSGTAFAQDSDSAIGNETPTADQAQDKVETTAAAKETRDFKIPPGYRAKKRGKKTVYCKKGMESGTRFASERCYDEAQLKEIESSREQEQADFDRARKVCSSMEVCGSG